MLLPETEERDTEREEVPALTQTAVLAPPPEEGGEDRDGEAAGGAIPVEAEDRSGGRTAGEIMAERSGETENRGGAAGGAVPVETKDRSGGRTAGEIVEERTGETDGEELLLGDGPVWTVRSAGPETGSGTPKAQVPLTVQGLWAARSAQEAQSSRGTQASQTAQPLQAVPVGGAALDSPAASARAGAEWALRGGRTGAASESVRAAERGGTAGTVLEGLYRQAVGAARPAAPALPPEQGGRSVRARDAGEASALAVDELDRAVRRDSRRYDGGMSIF